MNFKYSHTGALITSLTIAIICALVLMGEVYVMVIVAVVLTVLIAMYIGGAL